MALSLRIEDLAQCTGFPPEVLLDFAERGLLPRMESRKAERDTYDGLSLLRQLEEVNHAG